jgi:hypothetical protein
MRGRAVSRPMPIAVVSSHAIPMPHSVSTLCYNITDHGGCRDQRRAPQRRFRDQPLRSFHFYNGGLSAAAAYGAIALILVASLVLDMTNVSITLATPRR